MKKPFSSRSPYWFVTSVTSAANSTGSLISSDVDTKTLASSNLEEVYQLKAIWLVGSPLIEVITRLGVSFLAISATAGFSSTNSKS